LCKLLNVLKPGTIPEKSISTSSMAFKQMENVAAFIAGARKLGVPDNYNFMTVDLYEGKNLGQVVECLISLKRMKGGGYNKQAKTSTYTVNITTKDQTTSSKSQEELISREPRQMDSSTEVKRTGPAMVSGRLTNETAMKCPVCTQFITSGAVNALGKSWHTNCFNCRKCGVKLSTAKYYEHSDQPYCERCILIVKPQTQIRGTTSNLATNKGFQF